MGRRVTDAILDCHAKGIITSTTLMANMPAAAYACERARDFPDLGVGVHLTLSQGRPVLPPDQVPGLVDGEGQFLANAVQRRKLWCDRGGIAEQVEREFEAQVQRAVDLGLSPTHADSHHGIHKMPVARGAMIRVLKRFDIRRARAATAYYWTAPDAPWGVRLRRMMQNGRLAHRAAAHAWNRWVLHRSGIRTPDYKVNRPLLIPSRPTPKEQLLACLASLWPGVSEMAFHPGYPDPDVVDPPHFAGVRDVDTALVLDPEVVRAVETHGIRLIHFGGF